MDQTKSLVLKGCGEIFSANSIHQIKSNSLES